MRCLGRIVERRCAILSYQFDCGAGKRIGGAVIIDGKLYKGLRSKAGEIGTILCDFDPGTQKAVTFGRKNSAVWLVRDMAKALGLDHEDGREIFDM